MTKSSTIIFLLALMLAVSGEAKFRAFPFQSSLEDRAEDILSALRSRMELDISDKNVLNAFNNAPQNELLLNNLEAIPLAVRIKTGKDAKKYNQDYLYDANALSAMLEGTCSALGGEYWNYEWCHRRDVQQYHIEKDGRKIIKQPNWSLGKYKKTMVAREKPSPENKQEKTRITTMIEHFQDGRICDETKQPRSTAVHIQCCDDLSYPNIVSSDMYYAQLEELQNGNDGIVSMPMPKATLTEILEPSVCTYQAIVCSPIMCPRDKSSQSSSAATSNTKSTSIATNTNKQSVSMIHIMQGIRSVCLSKPENWWTYEVCFNQGIRQVRFDVEQIVTADGVTMQKQVIANQFNLGNAPVAIYTNETALWQRTKYQGQWEAQQNQTNEEHMLWNQLGMLASRFTRRSSIEDQDYLSLEFQDGTLCDLDRINRSTVIDLHCGKHNALTQIREVSTCHYHAKVELPILCQLPGFAPEKEKITTLLWKSLVAESEFEDGDNVGSSSISTSTAAKPSSVSSKSDEPMNAQEIVVNPTGFQTIPPATSSSETSATVEEQNKIIEDNKHSNSNGASSNTMQQEDNPQEHVVDHHEHQEQQEIIDHPNDDHKDDAVVLQQSQDVDATTALPVSISSETIANEGTVATQEKKERIPAEEQSFEKEESKITEREEEEEYVFPTATADSFFSSSEDESNISPVANNNGGNSGGRTVDPKIIAMIREQLQQSFDEPLSEEMLDNTVDQIIASLQNIPQDGDFHEIVLNIEGLNEDIKHITLPTDQPLLLDDVYLEDYYEDFHYADYDDFDLDYDGYAMGNDDDNGDDNTRTVQRAQASSSSSSQSKQNNQQQKNSKDKRKKEQQKKQSPKKPSTTRNNIYRDNKLTTSKKEPSIKRKQVRNDDGKDHNNQEEPLPAGVVPLQ